jgi:DNA-binding NarL/FixJ family response regulator
MSVDEEVQLGIVVACDYPIVRESVAHVLSASGRFYVKPEAFDMPAARPCPCDVVLCISEARPDLEATLHRVRQRYPDAKLACIMLGDDERSVITALRAGATGIIDDTLNASDPGSLIEKLEVIASGEFVLSAQMATRLARMHAHYSGRQPEVTKTDWLTQREQEVLGLLARGSTNKHIAERLCVSEHTVRAHLRGIMQKLQVSNRVQAAALAWRNNLVPQTPSEE